MILKSSCDKKEKAKLKAESEDWQKFQCHQYSYYVTMENETF